MSINDPYEIAYAVIDSGTGTIKRTGTCAIESLHLQIGPGELIADLIEGVTDDTCYWDGEFFAELPEKPGPWAEWSGSEWIDPRTSDDLAAEVDAHLFKLRSERNRRLALCDWTQVPDVPLTTVQRSAWQSYRQALRDLPETTEDPASPVWPVAPSA